MKASSPAPSRGCARPRQEGITLLEVTVTLLVLSMIALGVALLVVPVARQSQVNQEVLAANGEARRMLEEIQATPFCDLLSRFPDGSERTIPDFDEGRLLVSYEDIGADPLFITLELEWNSPSLGSMRRTFQTVRTE